MILIQPVSDHDIPMLEQENAHIRRLTGRDDYLLAAVRVSSWNDDLSPWKAPPAFGGASFGGCGEETLRTLSGEILPLLLGDRCLKGRWICLGGYSIAGLFALWAGCRTNVFTGIAAASPSVWFPGFQEYFQSSQMNAKKIYLSMGDREVKTPGVSAAALEETQLCLDAQGKECVLVWNPGNHFCEPELRTARAFAWLINRFRK